MIQVTINLLGEATFAEKLLDSITVTVVGMGIVVMALLVMGEIFKLLGQLLASPPPIEDKPRPSSIPTVSPQDARPESRSVDSEPTDSQLIVILAAAATAALGRRVKVRRITFINHNTVSGWAEAGRIFIQTSHNIQRK